MKTERKLARAEVKELILKKGIDNILNMDITEIRERTGLSITDIYNAINYFRYSPKTAQYR